jgi:hypothetical protein
LRLVLGAVLVRLVRVRLFLGWRPSLVRLLRLVRRVCLVLLHPVRRVLTPLLHRRRPGTTRARVVPAANGSCQVRWR